MKSNPAEVKSPRSNLSVDSPCASLIAQSSSSSQDCYEEIEFESKSEGRSPPVPQLKDLVLMNEKFEIKQMIPSKPTNEVEIKRIKPAAKRCLPGFCISDTESLGQTRIILANIATDMEDDDNKMAPQQEDSTLKDFSDTKDPEPNPSGLPDENKSELENSVGLSNENESEPENSVSLSDEKESERQNHPDESKSEPPNYRVPKTSTSKYRNRPPPGSLTCELCGHIAKTQSRAREHVWCHTKPFICDFPDCVYRTTRPFLLKQHKICHDPDPIKRHPYACTWPKCTFRTSNNPKLFIHMETHERRARKTPLKCPDCVRKFRYKSSLESHRQIHKYKYIKRLKCPHCNYRSNRTQHYRQHVVKHNEERPFACRFCPHRSKWPQNVKKHELMFHSGIPRVKKPRKPRPKRDPATIEPWRCSYAGCDFKTKHSRRDLEVHEQKHLVNRPRESECPFCHNKFYRVAHARRHMQICLQNPTARGVRSKYKCPEPKCKYSSRDRWFVQHHMIVHRDDKPFKCPVQGCGYASKWSKSLPYHMSVHKDIQPFACSFPGCSFRSKWAKNIPVHEKRFHPALDSTNIRQEFLYSDDEEDVYEAEDSNDEEEDYKPENMEKSCRRSTRQASRHESCSQISTSSQACSQQSNTTALAGPIRRSLRTKKPTNFSLFDLSPYGKVKQRLKETYDARKTSLKSPSTSKIPIGRDATRSISVSSPKGQMMPQKKHSKSQTTYGRPGKEIKQDESIPESPQDHEPTSIRTSTRYRVKSRIIRSLKSKPQENAKVPASSKESRKISSQTSQVCLQCSQCTFKAKSVPGLKRHQVVHNRIKIKF